MPSIKRSGVKSEEVKTGFEPYDGPPIKKRGMYRAKITSFKYKIFGTGTTGLSLVAELEAAAGDPKDHAQFDGMPLFPKIYFGDKEGLITRESNFYAALGIPSDPNIVTKENITEKNESTDVKSIGGKSVEALSKIYVNLDVKVRNDGDYAGEPEVDGVYKLSEQGASAKATATAKRGSGRAAALEEPEDESEEEAEEPDDEPEGGEDERAEREAELNAASVADLKTLATSDYDLTVKPATKPNLVAAILAYEFDDEAEEADEVDEEDEPDDEDDSEREAREAELSELDRAGLKRILAKLDKDFTVLKRHTDEDIIAEILNREFGEDGETPF